MTYVVSAEIQVVGEGRQLGRRPCTDTVRKLQVMTRFPLSDEV